MESGGGETEETSLRGSLKVKSGGYLKKWGLCIPCA